MEEKVLIEAKNLKKYFKVGANSQLHAVDGVNFKIKRGTTLGVVGESGCGKSTLGRLLLRLYDVTDGQIIYDGTDITKLNAKELKPIRARMQMIFQDPSGSLDPRKSVKELIGEPLKIYKACKNRDEYDARIAEIMETVGLDERYAESFSHELDGGRRQRIGSMVGLGRLVKRKQMANHVLHLILLGRSLSHHGELYLARGVLAHGKAALGAGHERRPAGLARGEGGRDVLPEPDRLDADAFRTKALDHRADLVVNLHETLGQRLRCRCGHAAVGHARKMRPALLDDPPARMGEPGIDPHHDARLASQKISPTFQIRVGLILEHMFVKGKQNYGRWPMPPSNVRVSPLMNLKSGLASCTTTRPISFSTSP